MYAVIVDAGWSSLVARRAHNPKVVGSNPAPATNLFIWILLCDVLNIADGHNHFGNEISLNNPK